MKYNRPQDHFKDIVLAIAESANFDVIKQRIRQIIQVGFALSSDIWIASLLDRIENKKSSVLPEHAQCKAQRQPGERSNMLHRYSNQFLTTTFFCTFSSNSLGLQVEEQSLKIFFSNELHFAVKT